MWYQDSLIELKYVYASAAAGSDASYWTKLSGSIYRLPEAPVRLQSCLVLQLCEAPRPLTAWVNKYETISYIVWLWVSVGLQWEFGLADLMLWLLLRLSWIPATFILSTRPIRSSLLFLVKRIA